MTLLISEAKQAVGNDTRILKAIPAKAKYLEYLKAPFTIMLPSDIKQGTHPLTVKVIDSANKGGFWKNVYLISKKTQK